MFHTGDLIIYGGEGVCRVTAVGPAPVAAADPARLYYTLAPVYHKGVVYAPVDVNVPMRPVLTREDALTLIHAIPQMKQSSAECQDSKQAAAEYNALLKSYDCASLLRLIRMIYSKNEKAITAGKEYSQVDKRFLRRACELLHGELAAALGADPCEVDYAAFIFIYCILFSHSRFFKFSMQFFVNFLQVYLCMPFFFIDTTCMPGV